MRLRAMLANDNEDRQLWWAMVVEEADVITRPETRPLWMSTKPVHLEEAVAEAQLQLDLLEKT